MAKLTARGNGIELYRLQRGDSMMAIFDSGKVLQKSRICGKWEGWRVAPVYVDNHQRSDFVFRMCAAGYKVV